MTLNNYGIVRVLSSMSILLSPIIILYITFVANDPRHMILFVGAAFTSLSGLIITSLVASLLPWTTGIYKSLIGVIAFELMTTLLYKYLYIQLGTMFGKKYRIPFLHESKIKRHGIIAGIGSATVYTLMGITTPLSMLSGYATLYVCPVIPHLDYVIYSKSLHSFCIIGYVALHFSWHDNVWVRLFLVGAYIAYKFSHFVAHHFNCYSALALQGFIVLLIWTFLFASSIGIKKKLKKVVPPRKPSLSNHELLTEMGSDEELNSDSLLADEIQPMNTNNDEEGTTTMQDDLNMLETSEDEDEGPSSNIQYKSGVDANS